MRRSLEHFAERSVIAVFVFAVAAILGSVPAGAQESKPEQMKVVVSKQPDGKAFKTPQEAAAAIYAACRRNDEDAMLVILGSGAKDLIFWDTDAAARKERHQEYAQKYDQMHRLVHEPDGTVALYIGAENWPTPIPLVEYKGMWYFDADLGRMEVMYRRIGRNEVEALQVCQALVDAEKDYFGAAHVYTAKFVSSSGAHDGLYWNTTEGAAKSPIGPYLAHAGVNDDGTKGQPYHGYYYRIVMDSGSASNFTIVAFPAAYRMSGVMTFQMNQNGEAYEKDLGENTADAAKKISSFSPDNPWKKVD